MATISLVSATAGEHPSLLLRADDLPRLRHVAGIGSPSGDATHGRYAAFAADYHALRVAIRDSQVEAPLPGDLLGCAFLLLIDPLSSERDARLARLTSWITRPDSVAMDPLSVIIAMDWTWKELPVDLRRDTLSAIRARATPFATTDSPLRRDEFLARLADLAMAIAVDEEDEPSQAWAQIRGELIRAGREYARETLPRFLSLRGLAPTSPSTAADEEAGIVLLVELTAAMERRARGEIEAAVAASPDPTRVLEHYAMVAGAVDPEGRQFVRDDGDEAPLLTCGRWERLTPLTAHLLAARTGDPAAVWMAGRVETELRKRPERGSWRFLPLLFDLRGRRPVGLDSLPIVRDLGSAVVFRSAGPDAATFIWVETPVAHLRSRQYFDAGHFLVRRGGDLVASAAVDVAHEAVPVKGGSQHAGSESDPAALTQFAAATIAHNAMIFFESGRTPTHEGRRYRPLGGQRAISGDWPDYGSESDMANPRRLGGLLAVGEVCGAAYAALDLAPAYSPGAIRAYVREFIWFPPDALLVIDRFSLRDAGTTPTWVMQLTTRPTPPIGGLSDQNRAAGATNDAGVWQIDEPRVEWSGADERAALQTLHPARVRFRVVGGPARRLDIEGGPHAGRTYVGGSAASFERLLTPVGSKSLINAWFRLGAPTRLGREFGTIPHWGRVEVEPATRGLEHTMVHVVHVGGSEAPLSSSECVATADGWLQVHVRGAKRLWTLRIRDGVERGGEIALAESAAPTISADEAAAGTIQFTPLPSGRAPITPLPAREADSP
ncbi:MAG: hypothetical protein HRU75_07990 [Planctomycetia bacterium]|nr:MAG: hypothetical protein HRU75_07990 [Planctomycetia bacterium]